MTLLEKGRNFPGGPGAKTVLPAQGLWVQSLVRDSHMLKLRVHMLQIPPAATKTWDSQIKKKPEPNSASSSVGVPGTRLTLPPGLAITFGQYR